MNLLIWNIANLFLFTIILACMAYGWSRGFWMSLLDLVTWVVSLSVALALSQPVAGWLERLPGLSKVWALPLAFALLVIGTGVLLVLAGRALLRRVPAETHRATWTRVLGLLPGLVNGLILAAMVAALLLALPMPGELGRAARSSEVVDDLAGFTHRLETTLAPVFNPAIAQTLAMFTVPPESHEFIELPYRETEVEPCPELEAQMLDLINQERAKAGLPPLKLDPALVPIARAHSADMLARGYFSHVTPEGQDPFERLNEAGITYLAAGENLAMATTLSLAHNGLMNSPDHQANILQPAFKRVGIGIMDGGGLGLMITQLFRD